MSIIEADGRRAIFWKSGSTWTPNTGVTGTLTAGGGGGWLLTTHGQTRLSFDSAGKLTSIADRNSNTQTLSYTANRLSGVTAPGASLTITTDANGHITAINGPGGLNSVYTYDANGNLATARASRTAAASPPTPTTSSTNSPASPGHPA